MPRIKQWLWIITCLFILGPLAVVVVLGQWADEAFEYLDPLMGEEED